MPDPDLSEFVALARPRRAPCRVKPALDALDKHEREQFDAAIAADRGLINDSAIARWLEVRGHTLSVGAVTSHRRQTCACHG